MEEVLDQRVKDIKAIPPNIHVTSLGTVVGGDWSLDDAKPLELELDQDFRIEMVVIRACIKRYLFEGCTAKDTEPGVVLREVPIQDVILDGSQELVAQKPVEWHSAS